MKRLQPNEILRKWPVSEIARLDRMFRPALENANQDDYLCQVKTAAPSPHFRLMEGMEVYNLDGGP